MGEIVLEKIEQEKKLALAAFAKWLNEHDFLKYVRDGEYSVVVDRFLKEKNDVRTE